MTTRTLVGVSNRLTPPHCGYKSTAVLWNRPGSLKCCNAVLVVARLPDLTYSVFMLCPDDVDLLHLLARGLCR